MYKIEKSEWTYLFFSAITIGFLAFVIINEKVKEYISSLNPIYQFVIMNLGIFFVFFFLIKFFATDREGTWRGSLGAVMSFLAFDLVLPEYHVGLSGLIDGGVFGASATDYFFGYLYSTFLGASGITLVLMVYVLTFVVLFGAGALLVKNFVEEI